MRERRWLALIGMMGAGKSTLGRALATHLDLEFEDLDARIVAAAGESIPEIFAQRGEAHFRELEATALSEILRQRPCGILATGGGVVERDTNRSLLHDGAHTIYLELPLHALIQRLRAPEALARRPLLAAQDPAACAHTLERLLSSRERFYVQADRRVNADRPVPRLIEELSPVARRICTGHDA